MKMKKIRNFVGLLFVLVLAQGCATANTDQTSLHTRGMEQVVQRNDITLSASCSQLRVRAISVAKYEAIQNGELAKNWPNYYNTPSCVLDEQNTWKRKQAVIPREFGFTLADLAELDYDELCDKSPLKRMGTSRGMVWLADQGIPSEFYESISKECIRRDKEKTKRSFVWNNLFYRISPQVGYGYGYGYGNYGYRGYYGGYYNNHSYYSGSSYEGGAYMGKTRRALIRRANRHRH